MGLLDEALHLSPDQGPDQRARQPSARRAQQNSAGAQCAACTRLMGRRRGRCRLRPRHQGAGPKSINVPLPMWERVPADVSRRPIESIDRDPSSPRGTNRSLICAHSERRTPVFGRGRSRGGWRTEGLRGARLR